MPLDPNYVFSLGPVDFKVLYEVANARRIALKDLWDSIGSKEEVSESVKKLSSFGLIKEAPASLQDFSTFYVTAEGLTAERQMKRSHSGAQTSAFVVAKKSKTTGT